MMQKVVCDICGDECFITDGEDNGWEILGYDEDKEEWYGICTECMKTRYDILAEMIK